MRGSETGRNRSRAEGEIRKSLESSMLPLSTDFIYTTLSDVMGLAAYRADLTSLCQSDHTHDPTPTTPLGAGPSIPPRGQCSCKGDFYSRKRGFQIYRKSVFVVWMMLS